MTTPIALRPPRKIVWLSIAMLIATLLVGCFNFKQPSPEIAFYTLDYAPPVLAPAPALTAVLQIKRFATAPTYDSRDLIYAASPYRRDTDPYHKWHARPGELVAQMLVRDLQKSRRFKAAFGPEAAQGASHALKGRVNVILARKSGKSREAVLDLNVTLMNEGEFSVRNQIVFQKTFSAVEPCADDAPGAVAAAMSQAMKRISGELIEAVYDALKSS